MASLRGSTGGDMGPFIVEMDLLITEVNAAIDAERRDAPPRAPPSAGGRMMRDFPDCTNDFLHHFLDGVLEAVEKERASGGGGGRGRAISAGGMHLGGSGRATPTGERRRFASASVHK
ncbi:hypothetical protein HYH03_007860 [Edaphochlamys debaryana]|uniref:Uncharacterized protein n=1 Tax=Edaphochlamys debaryana TaxID=47281 RepID=A0A836BZZ9_9CHLO|nr:hypothetical protein HYH03_007860 [Edaphochlamys debaryana]|eukprot:KAG2493929.1 hypothetical protein HYH03_007860 [Edaphochlamys debaryana]